MTEITKEKFVELLHGMVMVSTYDGKLMQQVLEKKKFAPTRCDLKALKERKKAADKTLSELERIVTQPAHTRVAYINHWIGLENKARSASAEDVIAEFGEYLALMTKFTEAAKRWADKNTKVVLNSNVGFDRLMEVMKTSIARYLEAARNRVDYVGFINEVTNLQVADSMISNRLLLAREACEDVRKQINTFEWKHEQEKDFASILNGIVAEAFKK